MKIVFMGTPGFAATILEELHQHHDVVAVYTRADAVSARGNKPRPSPVKMLANDLGLTVKVAKNFSEKTVLEDLAAFEPDVICVAAFGAILPQEVLDIAPLGALNVHASLLPAYRGAAPVERAILADEKETGVCVMKMQESLDSGPYCICRTVIIQDKNAGELADKLANLGAQALLSALVHLQENSLFWIEQDDSKATYAHKIKKGELYPTPKDRAKQITLKVRASSEAHPARAIIAGRSLTLIKVREILDDEQAQTLSKDMKSGDVRFTEKRLFLGAEDNAIEILLLKPDGKHEMDAKSFGAGIQSIKDGSFSWGAL
jgi:methionyl-tRNA formyltransferase